MKLNHVEATPEILQMKATSKGELQKWIQFCAYMIGFGFHVSIYEARKTKSKYITVTNKQNNREFKVRFSDHKPIKYRELKGDCDFFVGRTHTGTTTKNEAIFETIYQLTKD